MEYQTRSRDVPWMGWTGAVALGALVMYVVDPAEGRRRRALLMDKVTHYSKATQRRFSRKLRDARNRLAGLQAETLRLNSTRDAKPIDNHVLEARVRSRMARLFPEVEGVFTSADQGLVTLSGQMDEAIEHPLIEMVENIPGVDSVSYRKLGTAQKRHIHGLSIFEDHSPLWIAGAVGAGLLTWYGLTRQQPLGLIAAATGVGLLTRGQGRHQKGAMTNISTHAIEAERSIDINASPELVYDLCSHCENFPHFMSHVIDVRDLGNHRAHWLVQGHGGNEVEFDTRLTDSDRPHRIAWRTEPGSVVDSEGVITLRPHASGTRVTWRMAWQAPAGAVTTAVVVLTGTHPESELEDDLRRMKQFIEHGQQPRETAGGAAVLH